MAKHRRDGETADTIAAILRTEIIRCVLHPGQTLRQEKLAARFKTSRMPIRDGLKILEHQGLILLPTNRSAQIAPLDPKSLQEISEMRAVAETLALTHAIPELSNSQILAVAQIQDEAELADIDAFPRLNKAFHTALLSPCNRPRLLHHIATLNDLSERFFHFAAVALNYADQSHKEHRELLAACEQRNVSAACRILESHISNANESLLEALKSGNTGHSASQVDIQTTRRRK